ncbi:MAG: CDP-diacylglycerol--glycerol-3-phosphate 3-phosphatidyltransferase [Proteobacteria bacterium]|nr:CDP-diacylglycerol--glycerol-3-phosphate 3-phosphatidyltransferase [Pseudomonadota bacterium]
MQNLPNILTLLRIAVIPLFVGAFYLGGTLAAWVAFGLFVTAAVTDYFDGMLARKLGVTSPFGACLDPIADKLLVFAALFMLVGSQPQLLIPAVIIAFREVLISGMREYLAKAGVDLKVTGLAKWKTTVQMTAISAVILSGGFSDAATAGGLLTLGVVLMWVAVILTVLTGVDYVRKALPHLRWSSSTPD